MILGRWRAHIRRIGNALLLGLLVGGAGEPWAEMPGLFEVRDVKVDVTADTAAAAREKALVEGQRRAFRILIDRLMLPADRAKLLEASRTEIDQLVQDFSVSQEKTSAVRYIATLNYRFREDGVRRLLVSRGVPFAATRAKTILVVPVYQVSGTSVLWDDPSPWRQAWANVNSSGLVPIVLPIGDLTDVTTVGPEEALAADRARLDALAQRYNAGDVLVAVGALDTDARTGLAQVKVSFQGLGGEVVKPTPARTFKANQTESIDELLNRAAAVTAKAIEDDWKRQTLLPVGPAAGVQVKVPISGLSDWVAVRRRLQGVVAVDHVDLILLSREEAWINIVYFGTLDQLALALGQADLALKREGEGWTLELTPALAQQRS